MLAALAVDRDRIADNEAQITQLESSTRGLRDEKDPLSRPHTASQISHLERSILTLRTEKELAQERLSSYKYPVLTLPNELITEILIHFLPTFPKCPPTHGVFSPTVLTQICSHLRRVAVATPALWRAIQVFDRQDAPTIQQQLLSCDIWFSRTRSITLTLEIRAASLPPIGFSSVLPHRAHWQHLKLELDDSSRLRSIIGPMPQLQHLEMRLPSIGGEAVALHDVPLLHAVSLTYIDLAPVILPWAQLTSLILTTVFPREYLPILEQASSLVYCELLIVFTGYLQFPPNVIRLPHLETLILTDKEPRSGRHEQGDQGLLHFIIAHALQRLDVPTRFLGLDPVDSLRAFFSNSGCNLYELAIIGGPIKHSQYVAAFPSIQNLYLDWEDEDDESEDSESLFSV
ncbi:hypothetical protein C8F04DRAFT_1232854 [Mycena alexandri]|uniref:F-box domain-containing protein n=1 Tax=Mycena alexandri TaxID=1745969 RepID=A0AAD6T1X5_9AGAR|nr:hypothetical protein C8F04DRAFT_1232854 [Mycena alexandri]